MDQREVGRLRAEAAREYYALTRAGRKQLEKETASWERLAAAVTLVVRTT